MSVMMDFLSLHYFFEFIRIRYTGVVVGKSTIEKVLGRLQGAIGPSLLCHNKLAKLVAFLGVSWGSPIKINKRLLGKCQDTDI